MKKATSIRVTALVIAACISIMHLPVLAAGQHYMYSRYDGAAILVNTGEEAAFAQGYANPDETVTVFSRVDGARAVIWSYEVAKNQSHYATGQQNIRMFSKYDGAMILVHSYEAAGYSANYYGEKATVVVYDKKSGFDYTIWASDLASHLNKGFSTTRPYIPVYGYADFKSVPSFGSMIGMKDDPLFSEEIITYLYKLSHNNAVKAAKRYFKELEQWGYWYCGQDNNGVDLYYNGTSGVEIGYNYSSNTVVIVIWV